MKGLELSKKYYEEYKDILFEEIGDLKSYLAFGLVGSGSECYGFDDEISTDHDFEPGFCIFAPDTLDRKDLFKIERAYAKLPKEFLGYKRSILENNRHGLILTSSFYKQKIGSLDTNSLSLSWFNIPSNYLSEATNGEVFDDFLGEFSKIRASISYFPEDIRLKKIAACLVIMSQAGVYNYKRMIKRGDSASSQLAIINYVNAVIDIIFLLNKVYKPYYKWQFRYLKQLPILSDLANVLEYLISIYNSNDNRNSKKEMIEDINNMIIDEIKNQNLSKEFCSDLENNAFSINDKIENEEIRNLDILYAI